jgi:hypothetical protein
MTGSDNRRFGAIPEHRFCGGVSLREDWSMAFDSNDKIGVYKAPRRIRYRNFLAPLFAIGFAVLCSSPCDGISQTIDPFKPATAEEAARWIRLLKLEATPGVEIKSATMQLIDVTLSITRIESGGCSQGVCATFFKYHLDKDFEFIIPCKPKMTVLVMMREDDLTGKEVVSIVLATGYDLTVTVLPTSLGPIIRTTHGDLP